jgi:hypothetical protein
MRESERCQAHKTKPREAPRIGSLSFSTYLTNRARIRDTVLLGPLTSRCCRLGSPAVVLLMPRPPQHLLQLMILIRYVPGTRRRQERLSLTLYLSLECSLLPYSAQRPDGGTMVGPVGVPRPTVSLRLAAANTEQDMFFITITYELFHPKFRALSGQPEVVVHKFAREVEVSKMCLLSTPAWLTPTSVCSVRYTKCSGPATELKHTANGDILSATAKVYSRAFFSPCAALRSDTIHVGYLLSSPFRSDPRCERQAPE